MYEKIYRTLERGQFQIRILDANLPRVWQKTSGESRVFRVVPARLRKIDEGLDRNDALELLLSLLLLRYAKAFPCALKEPGRES
jgi:hypothetical protein